MNLDRILAVRNDKTVYRDGNLCLKVFNSDFSKADVLNEALNQARIEETGLNIPKIHEVTVIEGKWTIVYDYISGKTLAQLMEEHPEKKEEYLAATEKARDYITSFENRYAADILPEDSIMMVKNMETATRTYVANISFGTIAEVAYDAQASADNSALAAATASSCFRISSVHPWAYREYKVHYIPYPCPADNTYSGSYCRTIFRYHHYS